MMSNSDALIVFVKNPVAGKVKTRLAATLGSPQALEIYLKLLAKTRNTVASLACTRYVFYSDTVDEADEWTSPPFLKRLQQGPDLGIRMYAALREVLNHHPKAALIGSDIPELAGTQLQAAFLALDTHDYVLGPAKDGGYYLIGMKTPSAAVFEGITWSTSTVLQQTLQHIHNSGKTCYLLPELSDVDTAADWEKVQW
jgi:hypothetical protein